MQKRCKKKNLKNAFMRRVIALFVAVLMVLGIAIPNVLEVQAVSTRVADTDTSDTYLDEGFLGHPYSTEFAGRIWTDKSVNTLDSGNGDFQVTYSALATAKSVTGQTMSPLDVVFIIDISGSMVNNNSGMTDPDTNQRYSRMKFTVDAVNAAIQDIMDMNEHTRVAVVAFSDSAQVLLPLDHYSPEVNRQGNAYPYFSLDKTEPLGANAVQNNYPILTTRAVDSNGDPLDVDNIRVYGGTNIQQGVYTGSALLTAANNETTALINGVEVPRIPSVVLLSDGAPTYSSASEDWWAPNPTDGLLSTGGTDNKYYYGNGIKAMMTAAYMKQAVNAKYKVTNANSEYAVTYHTIGMGLAQLTGDARDLANITLNPAAHWNNNNTMANNIRSKWGEYTRAGNRSISVTVNSGILNNSDTLSHPSSNDISSINNWVKQYHSADSAEEIAEVFVDIVSELSISTPEVPTEIKAGETLENSGYLTYTDPIGHYMEVKSIQKLSYAGVDYTDPVQGTDQNGAVTYTFTAAVTGADENESNLRNISITLDTDDNGHQTLKVMIPANLIPLRVNTVALDHNNVVQTHTHNNEQPFRLYYTVGLRSDIYDRELGYILINPDGEYFTTDAQKEAYHTYLEDNKDAADGTVKFYSNLYTANTINGTTVGNATVEFEPSHTNPFYYMQELIPVFEDEDLKIPVTTEVLIADKTYYYEETYYHNDETVRKIVERTGAQLMNTAHDVVDGQWARLPGSPRVNKIQVFDGTKSAEANKTNTANEFYEPTFVHADGNPDPYAGKYVTYLGNNGVLTVKTTGTLEISKEVTAADGLTVPEDKEFTFTVNLEDADGNALTGTYEYSVVDTDGNPVTDADGQPIQGTISDGGTIALKDGQTAQIINLPSDAEYIVTETKQDGFTTKINGIDVPADADLVTSGMIIDGETARVEFVNHYSTTKITIEPEDTELGFSGKKILSGREWDDSDSYTFIMESHSLTAPMPEGAIQIQQSHKLKEITVTKADANDVFAAFDFGSITYDRDGVFVYTISERVPAVGLPGISYSGAMYQVTVTVTDNGDGTLSAETKMTQMRDDSGVSINEGTGVEDADKVAEFTNIFATDHVNWTPVGTKDYVDYSGTNRLRNDMFSFLISVHPDSPADTPLPQHVVETNVGTQIAYDTIVFTQDHVDVDEVTTYSYNFTEVIPEGAADNGNGTWSLNGMTYDGSTQRVDVKVYYDEDMKIVVEPVYTTVVDGVHYDRVVFFNEYRPKEVTLGEDIYAPLSGIKTLTGRDMLEGEAFEFILDAANDVTRTALADGTIVLKDEAVQALPISTTVSGGDDGVAQAFDFGKITFKKSGTYTFQIKEIAGNAGGVTYDTHTCYVRVVVTDVTDDAGNLLGKLSAEVTYYNGQGAADNTKAVFNNTYNATFNNDTAINLYGEKILTGRDLAAGEFFFRVEPQNGAPMGDSSPGTSHTAAGAITLLQNVTYTEVGEYVYLIRENVPSDDQKLGGITYDVDYTGEEVDTVYRVTVVVEDKLDGNLEASVAKVEVSQDNGVNYVIAANGAVVFNNKYTTENGTYGTASLQLRKVLDGKKLTEGTFEFVLSVPENSGNPEGGLILPADTTATNTATGAITFGELTFTKEGNYKIQVNEVLPEDVEYSEETSTYTLNGVTYDSHIVLVTFSVTDNGHGQLVARRTNMEGSPIFTNIYTPDPITETLTGIKKLNGRPFKDTDEFRITITAEDGTPLPAVTTVNTSDCAFVASSDTEKVVEFGPITYDAADTYVYTITEESGSISGITYDESSWTATVVVDYDSEEGKYVVSSVTYTKDDSAETESQFVFTNTYEAKPTDEVDVFKATKTVTPEDGNTFTMEADDFTFKIEPSDQNSEFDPISEKTVSNDADGKVVFAEDVVYTAPGDYIYSVYEVSDDQLPGVNYDGTHYTIVVKVSDPNQDGKLVADVTITAIKDNEETEVDSIVFENKYNPEDATAILSGDKSYVDTMSSKDLTLTDGQFTFKLSADEGTPLPNNTTAKNSASGHFAFDEIKYTKPGTYEYEITEVVPEDGAAGVTYDRTVYKAVVVVEDVAPENADNSEDSDLDTPDSDTSEENTSDDVTSETDTEEDETTEDVVTPEESTSEESTSEEDTSEENASEEAVVAAENVLPEEVVVAEAPAEAESKEQESNEAAVTVTVTPAADDSEDDDQDDIESSEENNDETVTGYGMLKATVTYYDAEGEEINAIQFNNSYKPESVTNITITGTKELTGRDLKEGEFTFQLIDSDNNVVSEDTNEADGTFTLTVDEIEAEGEYRYTVREVNTQAGGITYDTNVYTVIIKVSDVDAKLQADIVYYAGQEEVDELVVVNEYKAASAEIQLSVLKTLEGRKLEAGEFEFELKDESGQVIETAVNAEDGTVKFDKLVYDAEGIYKYTISEKQGTLEHVTYDRTVYNVTVTVTDDENGYLVATVDYDGKDPVFTNTYEVVTPTPSETPAPTPTVKPTTPTPKPTIPDGTVNTGDSSNVVGFLGMAVLALGVIFIQLRYFRKRTNR